ncbi:hypothetical protein FRB91_006841 [Serendipita sp. 411]|nr:hypothetical protein FRB91_006841 [Serendipita sp. 411]
MLPTMDASDLTATLTRLREMARATAQPVQVPPPPMPSYPAAPPFSAASQLPYSYPQPVPPIPHPSHIPAPAVSLPPGLNTQSIISLLSSITSLHSGKTAVDATSVEISASTSIEEYEKAILQRKIKLTSDDITKTTPQELESKVIVISPGEEGKEIRCAICTEAIRVEFLEEDGDGDWVWKNAVKVDNKIYHATCHHDWSTSSYNKNRLVDKGSRQGTPEIPSREGTTPQRLKSDSPRTPPTRLLTVAGTKRKAVANLETGGVTASPSSKEGSPLTKTAGDEPRIKRRAIQT